MRQSSVTTNQDKAGDYEVEVFDCVKPKGVIVTAHGNGVRRWDGEEFFYAVAEQYPNYVVMLIDQNQLYEDGCKLNDLQIMVDRVQKFSCSSYK